MAAAAWAGEPQADSATLHFPADVWFVVRFAPPERLDLIGKQLQPLLPQRMTHRSFADELLREIEGARDLPIDRSKPFYAAVSREGSQWLFHPRKDTDPRDLGAGGMLHLGNGGRSNAGPRTAPLELLPGDLSITVPVRHLVEENRALLEKSIREVSKLEGFAKSQGIPIPAAATRLVQTIADVALEGVLGVEDVHYALTWRGAKIESEGWIRSREDSSLQRWLNRLEPNPPSDLMGLLPHNALWMVESNGLAADLDGEIGSLFDRAFGEGAGHALLWLFSPSCGLQEHLTGRAAATVMLYGMAATSIHAVHELKSDTDIDEAIVAIDVKKINARFEQLGLPIEVVLERKMGRFRDSTDLHRLTYRSNDPQLAMLVSQWRICFAIEGRYLVLVQSPAADNELIGLLARIRDGKPEPHTHAKAMARLMPDRHEGISINAGALKPSLALFGMLSPEVAQAIQAMPDDFYFSTALAVRDGHIHLRGDWPFQKFIEFVGALQSKTR